MELVFDIGGTNLRMGVSRNGETLTKTLRVPVPQNYATMLRLFRETAAALAEGERIRIAAGGVTGSFDAQKAVLVRSTHLKQWVGKPLHRDLSRILRAPVFLENDCNLIGLGEAVAGSGKNFSLVAYIGIGTGIGGSKIVDGRIDRNTFGFEPGHHILNFLVKRHRHPSPHPGSWESYASGSALKLRFGKPAVSIETASVWRDLVDVVAVGLVNVAVFWSPDIIVLGGSILRRVSLPKLRTAFRSKLRILPGAPELVRSKLGEEGGLIGGLVYIKQSRRTRRRG